MSENSVDRPRGKAGSRFPTVPDKGAINMQLSFGRKRGRTERVRKRVTTWRQTQRKQTLHLMRNTLMPNCCSTVSIIPPHHLPVQPRLRSTFISHLFSLFLPAKAHNTLLAPGGQYDWYVCSVGHHLSCLWSSQSVMSTALLRRGPASSLFPSCTWKA